MKWLIITMARGSIHDMRDTHYIHNLLTPQKFTIVF